jgi:putative DeoR family transcriptional regulator (stage III sporulation protein D)
MRDRPIGAFRDNSAMGSAYGFLSDHIAVYDLYGKIQLLGLGAQKAELRLLMLNARPIHEDPYDSAVVGLGFDPLDQRGNRGHPLQHVRALKFCFFFDHKKSFSNNKMPTFRHILIGNNDYDRKKVETMMYISSSKERCVVLAAYLVEHKATVRSVASHFGISKSTVHKDITQTLKKVNKTLYEQAKEVLSVNKMERHIRGGEATKQKYSHRIIQNAKDT